MIGAGEKLNSYLNTATALENYKQLVRSKYFIDKSNIIEKINNNLETSDKYICVTKPRRFGKSSIINMIGAYYTKNHDSKDIFDELNISKSESYLNNLNKYNVIHLSFSEIPEKMKCYEDYISNIKNNLKIDLLNTFSGTLTKSEDLHKLLDKSGEKFIFIIDEWDYIFSHDLFKENQQQFLEFLRNLLKDRPYVALAYMTGVLPIKKYSEGSALNMFDEYTMLNDCVYDNFFGFTENEVKNLCRRQNVISFEEISEWYNGYLNDSGQKIYNPRSVVKALQNGKCRSYWTRTGKLNEVLFYLKYNISDVRNDAVKMVNNMPVRIKIKREYSAGQGAPRNREEIFSAMIVYGFLSYHKGMLKIPNKELMEEFEYVIIQKKKNINVK